ncbi:MAG: hypothetical protein GQ535_02100 [Rhodobacteraceae bacterium]|nr:hypothetical protein [Paracoccaceae bacterium]
MRVFTFLIFLFSPFFASALTYDEAFPNAQPYADPSVMAFLRSLDYKRGKISIPGGQVELNIPDGYYYLDSADADKVLIDLWATQMGTPLA